MSHVGRSGHAMLETDLGNDDGLPKSRRQLILTDKMESLLPFCCLFRGLSRTETNSTELTCIEIEGDSDQGFPESKFQFRMMTYARAI